MVTTLLVGCAPSPIEYRLADGKDVVVSRVGPCNDDYICVFEKVAGEVRHEVEYAILDPSDGANAKRPDLEVLKQLTNIARDNVGKKIRLGLSPTGTMIVGIEELEGQRRFVQGVELDWSAPVERQTESIFLLRYDLSTMTAGWGAPVVGKAVSGQPLRVKGVSFSNGIGTHAPSVWNIPINGSAISLAVTVGVQEYPENPGVGSVEFRILGDGRVLWTSGVMRGGDDVKLARANLQGVNELTLEVADGGDGIASDHANWIDGVITRFADSPSVIASPESDKSRYDELLETFKRSGESRSAIGSPREMTPTEDYCSRATSLSQGFAEMVAKRLQVSVDSVRLIRAEPMRVSGCVITMDTPVGPQSCQGGTVYSDGREYWIGGYCN
jgi:hypothetical protein